MKIKIFEDNIELSKQLCLDVLENEEIIIPSGSTPIEMYKQIVAYNLEDKVFIQLDEWVGIGPNTAGSCNQMLMNDFVKKGEEINLKAIDGTVDLAIIIEQMRNNLELGIDLSILGVGLNGHLGLNEPGVSYCEDVVVMPLSEKSKQVANNKYFKSETTIEYGVTYGIKALLASEKVIIVLNSLDKKSILSEIIHSNDQRIPAVYVKNMENVEFYVTKNII